MRDALATLPWVEKETFSADRATKRVRIGVNDKKLFDFNQIQDALPAKYQQGLTLVLVPD